MTSPVFANCASAITAFSTGFITIKNFSAFTEFAIDRKFTVCKTIPADHVPQAKTSNFTIELLLVAPKGFE